MAPVRASYTGRASGAATPAVPAGPDVLVQPARKTAAVRAQATVALTFRKDHPCQQCARQDMRVLFTSCKDARGALNRPSRLAKPVPSYRVILVGPKSQGNVGAVGRLMRNFAVEDLVVMGGPDLGDEAKERAMHAWDLVQRARRVDTFEQAIAGCDYVVGTSAKIPRSEKAHLRNPVAARELPARLADASGTVGLCFGREDFGLFNEELEKCDLLVTIPTSARYPSLNLSHAVGLVLYELYAYRHPGPIKLVRPMSETMRDKFFQTFDRLVDTLGLPEHKVYGTKIVARRVFGRAVLSAWEYFVFMGVLSRVLRQYGVEIESGRLEQAFEVPAGAEADFQSFLEDPRGSNA
jgi:tRNA/rRNA methyltransferase